METYKIIKLYNKKKEVVGETKVDVRHYDELLKHNINKTSDGYAQITTKPNRKIYKLHRFIYYILEENKVDDDKPYIDHINSDKLDNRLENLRDITIKGNALNYSKTSGKSSKYYGVFYDTKNAIYAINIKKDKLSYYFSYKIETHAAYHYDLLIKELYDEGVKKLNNVEEPDNFIRKVKKEKNETLPVGIRKHRRRYQVHFGKKFVKSFETAEEAINYRKELEIQDKETKELNITNSDIKQNTDNIAVIIMYNKNKEVSGEVLIDDDRYHDLLKYRWVKNRDGYAHAKIEKKDVRMHRYLLNYNGSDSVDHINGNRLDNRVNNLRIVTAQQNSQNATVRKDSTSGFIGVSKRELKWRASIRLNGKCEYLGTFLTPKEAALARDKKAKELNALGNNYKLNFAE